MRHRHILNGSATGILIALIVSWALITWFLIELARSAALMLH
jgi:hypothetical protein